MKKNVVYDRKDERVVTELNENSFKKNVILSFDDGPGRYLPKILDILRAEDVQCMFFWQSRLLFKERPWKQTLHDGHVIGSHSSRHKNLVKMNYDEQLKDIKDSTRIIKKITGQEVKYFRPPFGQYNVDTIKVCQELNLSLVMWKIAGFDWVPQHNKQEIIDNIINHLQEGAIILLHELKQTVDILPKLIYEIKGQGYHFTVLR